MADIPMNNELARPGIRVVRSDGDKVRIEEVTKEEARKLLSVRHEPQSKPPLEAAPAVQEDLLTVRHGLQAETLSMPLERFRGPYKGVAGKERTIGKVKRIVSSFFNRLSFLKETK